MKHIADEMQSSKAGLQLQQFARGSAPIASIKRLCKGVTAPEFTHRTLVAQPGFPGSLVRDNRAWSFFYSTRVSAVAGGPNPRYGNIILLGTMLRHGYNLVTLPVVDSIYFSSKGFVSSLFRLHGCLPFAPLFLCILCIMMLHIGS
jgi:hypothetical protein